MTVIVDNILTRELGGVLVQCCECDWAMRIEDAPETKYDLTQEQRALESHEFHVRDFHDRRDAAPSAISEIASPDAPITTNAQGGSQSHLPTRFDLIDAKAMFEMAKVLHEGAEKYGADNWRLIPINDHLNHLLMHTFAYLAGDKTDDHLSHILCRATFAMGVKCDEREG